MRECNSDKTDITVVDASWLLLEVMEAGVLDLW